jgi:glycosyltransferase involved in cell wall biosynthesis
VPLRIAAKIDRVDQEYFETTVRPLLNHPLVEFLGEVEESQKRVLLGNALALLFPIDWPEPFGLVMIEALASGTPVIARPCGSVPEVLRNGVTGLLCENEDAMVEAVHRVAALDRAACRQEFERRFTVQIMVQNYLTLYEETLRDKPLYPNTSSDLTLSQQVYSPADAKEIQ